MLTGYFDTERSGRDPTGAAGCLDNESAEDAFASSLVLLRVYENKGLPEPDAYAAAGVAFAQERGHAGQRLAPQGRNEPNNPFENTGLDPARYRSWFAAWQAEVRARDLGIECWWAPQSPGLDPMPWFEGCEAADGVVLHSYGLSVDELMGHVRAFRSAHPTVRWMLGECNYGPGEGRTCDRNAWAHDVLAPVLDECASLGCEAVLYFVYSGWEQDDASVGQETPLDAAGTAIDTVLRGWVPAVNGGAGDIALSVDVVEAPASPANYTKGPRRATRGVVIHTTRGGRDGATELYATTRWFQNPSAQVSAHLIVGNPQPEQVVRSVHDDDLAWHCREANATHLSVEICQGRDGDPISDFAYRLAAEACREWSRNYGFPLERRTTIAEPGLVGHEDTEPGKRDGKTDPGGAFDWEVFLSYAAGEEPWSVDAVRDDLWQIKDELSAHGWPRFAQAIEAAVTQSKGEP